MHCKLLAFLLLLISPAVALAEWQEASSKHFIVYSDDRPERVREFAMRLERFDKAIKVLRVVPEEDRGPASRVTVFVIDSISDIQRLAGGMRNVAGFYDARATGSVAFIPRKAGRGTGELDAMQILLHEYGHHFMFTHWPAAIYPKWFVEGFAEFHATALFRDDGSITFGAPPAYRASGVTLMNQMPLSQMLRPDPGKLSDLESHALYSRGWLLTHYLTFDPERRAQLASYVGAINQGRPVDEATKVFGNLNTLDIRLTNYAQRRSFATLTLPADQLPIGEVKVRQLGPGEAAIMPALLQSTAGVTDRTAPAVAELARKLAAPFPNDPAVQNALAEAEYDVKSYAQAEAAADRALAADPKSIHAMLYKGMTLQAVAEAAKSTDADRWKAVRRWYLAANKIAPEDPQPLILYYRSFKAAGQEPTQNAEAGLLYAFALAPHDARLRMEAARVHLKSGNAAEARRALIPVAYGDESKVANRIRTVLTELDKGSSAGLSALNHAEEEMKKEAETAKKD